MKIAWTPQAVGDLAALHDFVAEDNPDAARRLLQRIHNLVETLLPSMPNAGRPGRVAGTRELVVPGTPFIVPYREAGETIQILRVYHGARRWPDRL